MTARHFLDTNILLYSISSAPDEAAKRERAIELLETTPVACRSKSSKSSSYKPRERLALIG